MKAIDPANRVASQGAATWTVRAKYKLDEVRAAIAALGLREADHDVEGSRWDWTHVLTVEAPSEPKTRRQLDTEIAEVLKKVKS